MAIYNIPDLTLADWKTVYDIVLTCGRAHHPRAFAIDVVKNLHKVIGFDQSIVYFLDATGKTVGQYQKNVPERYGQLYLHYHMFLEGEKYPFGPNRENPSHINLYLFDWAKTDYYPRDLMEEFIYSRKLTRSCDFPLYDLNGNYRLIISLDRVENRKFTEKELTNLYLTVDQLNNIYKNFFFRDETLGNVSQADWAKWKLTAREIEIVDLLSQGMKPSGIADTLFISLATTYKHIQHIHEKMGISNNQELMVRLLNPKQ